MKPDSNTPERRDRRDRPERGGSAATTPGTDMQAEDAGTPASGNDNPGSARGTAAESAMKQTSKTPRESGGGR